MANKYILNPDGTIQKYTTKKERDDAESQLGLLVNVDTSQKTASEINAVPAYKQENITRGNSVNENIDFASLDFKKANSLFSRDKNDAPLFTNHKTIVETTSRNPSFGFEKFLNNNNVQQEHPGQLSYKSFNTFKEREMFADEFEILGGVRFNKEGEDNDGVGVELAYAMFSYFAESILRLVLVEGIVLLNRFAVSILKGKQSRTAERFVLRIGKYDFTEYDMFTRYVYNVLNYPHESSNMPERLVAYFVGFSEWLCPDTLIDLSELVNDWSSKESNDLELISSFSAGDHRGIYMIGTELAVIAYVSLKVMLSGLTNKTVANRANLLIRKFYQEKYWRDNILYGDHKPEESAILDIFTDLNYYYFKFYIERVQIGLKLIKKYVYDESYLPGRTKDSSFNRVSAQRSNRHIDYAIQFLTLPDGKMISGDIEDIIKNNLAKPDANAKQKKKARNEAIKAANELLPEALKLPLKDLEEIETTPYDWQHKHSDGDFDHPTTKNKKPGQTTRIRALPQLFSMHPSLYKALAVNGKGSIDLGIDLTQNFYKIAPDERRIPDYAVKEIENVLEAEYMPFYFHDVRTNEILSFHAFIESITDSFNPEYNSSSGFGRIDDVRTYIKTTRNLNLSFTLAATSEADHDLMWYQINKIVAMVYPQWSDGYSIKDKDFKYPFTQVPTASPLIRLRVGDVIKSNYSRTNLSRLHGVGERATDKTTSSSDNKKHELMPGLYRTSNPDLGLDLLPNGNWSGGKPRSIKIDHPVLIKNVIDERGDFYIVEIANPFYKELNPLDLLAIPPAIPTEKTIKVVADSSKIMTNKTQKNTMEQNTPLASELMKPIKKVGEAIKSNNPITKSYESGMSRGLAGFITQLDVNYNEVNWETSRIGSKAPMLVKITVNFAPIHDIPPGLDHNGMLRAPTYNVGRINNEFFGDPNDFSYAGSGRDMALAKYKYLDALNRKKS